MITFEASEHAALWDDLLADLDEPARGLFVRLAQLDHGSTLLRFLHANAHTLHVVDDIAFNLNVEGAAVESGLRALIELDLARQVDAAGVTLFGLTADPARQQLIRDLCDWQNRSLTCLAQLERVLGG